MQKRILGKNLEVSAVGLGCMGLSHAYGAATDFKTGKRLLHHAVQLGYTFFDTAEVYGTPDNPHHNEEMLGEALKPCRKSVQIATKFGIGFDMSSGVTPYPLVTDSRPQTIRAAVEGSLKRLQTDYIDLYYQHRPDKNVPVEEVAGVMAELIKEGKILHWGLSEATEETLRRAHAVCPVTAIQNRYHMMYRHYETLFPVLEELNVGLVAFSPLANGLLSGQYTAGTQFAEQGDYRASMPQFQKDAFEANQQLMALIRQTAEAKNATPAQISLAWMMNKKPYIVPIPGSRKTERLAENAGAAEVVLSAAEVAALDAALDKMPMSAVFGGSKIVNQ